MVPSGFSEGGLASSSSPASATCLAVIHRIATAEAREHFAIRLVIISFAPALQFDVAIQADLGGHLVVVNIQPVQSEHDPEVDEWRGAWLCFAAGEVVLAVREQLESGEALLPGVIGKIAEEIGAIVLADDVVVGFRDDATSETQANGLPRSADDFRDELPLLQVLLVEVRASTRRHEVKPGHSCGR